MRIFDHFDLIASIYETFIKPKEPAVLLRLADLPASGALLDAGGGTGRVTQFLKGRANPLVVVDLSCKMLSEARQKGGLNPVCSQTEKLPFADQTFARIIMVDALHHVYDQRRTLNELWRALQPGGRIVIEEPDVSTLSGKFIAVAEKLVLMRSHFLPIADIAACFGDKTAQTRVEVDGSTAWVVVDKG
jgi:ubiquinone/menaquinone biosynthesis C-methylase UbiE